MLTFDGWKRIDSPQERLVALIFDHTWLYRPGMWLIRNVPDDQMPEEETRLQRFGCNLLEIDSWWVTRKRRIRWATSPEGRTKLAKRREKAKKMTI